MELQGLVVKEQSGFFWVEVGDGAVYMCRLRGRLLEDAQASDIAAIGDRVRITILDDEDHKGLVEEVGKRISVISRALRTEGSRGAGSPEREHVIIANADQALFVFAATQPVPSSKLLDRFLVVGEKSGIPDLIVVVNKIDIADRDAVDKQFAPYREMGYPVIYTSAKQRIGVDELTERLSGKISVFTGQSGVGKSSLLNAVQPGLGRAVKSVSQSTSEGMHTTRDSELVKLATGGYLADTPGIRTLNIWDVEPEELDAYFRELAPYVSECRFGDCEHRNEPGCAVRRAVTAGKIHRSRYLSYVSLRDELEEAFAL